ncbi:hypothetical protein GALL_550470 [mine drainage metagenome]|uniref:Uncharacterized protein n=1 Tax=mine drainage metagenome TaxID=410659 RepID=A0A1J5PIM1_9ZZZZ
MPDLGHMGAQLVRAPRHGFKRHPRHPCAQEPQGKEIGLGAFGVRMLCHLIGMDADHLFALAHAPAPGCLHQPVFDRSLARVRHTRHHRPIDFARGMVAKRLAERARNTVGAGQHQDARGILVQPMHQLRFVFIAELQRLGQTVNMAFALTRAALARQARRLVKHDNMLVLPQNGVLNHPLVRNADAGFGRTRRGL